MKLLFSILFILVFSGCRTIRESTVQTRTDSVSIIETLHPYPVRVKGSTLSASLKLYVRSGQIEPASINIAGETSSLTITVDSLGRLNATAHTPERTDTIQVPHRTEYRANTNIEKKITKEINRGYPKLLIILSTVGLGFIALLAYRLIKYIRRKFPP